MVGQKEIYTPVLDEYLADFGLKRKSLAGKRILDAGAGLRQFAADCGEVGIMDVWSVARDSVDWLMTKERMAQVEKLNSESEWLALWREVEKKSQAGLFQSLPYAGESFDLVLSHNGVTQAFELEAEMAGAFAEIVRVLKPGGEAYFFPGWTDSWPREQRFVVIGALSQMMDFPRIKVEVRKIELKIGGLKMGGSMLVFRKD